MNRREKLEIIIKKKAKSLDVDKLNSLMKNAKMETLIAEAEARLIQVRWLVKKINNHKQREDKPLNKLGSPNLVGEHHGHYDPFHNPEIFSRTWEI